MDDLAGPHIHYIRTSDRVSLAWWTLGEGPPLVYLTGGPWSHIELWHLPECRRWYARLARGRMLVRYDQRGTGLSQRDVTDFSLDALVADLEAVVDHLDLDRFALFGAADAGQVALTYADRHPDRVSHLILWCTWPRMRDADRARLDAWRSLIVRDWELSTETCTHLALGWSGGEIGRQAARRLREVVTPRAMRDGLTAIEAFDVASLLPRIETPTLVLHRQDVDWLPVEAASSIAAHLPNARLAILPGEAMAPYMGDSAHVARLIDEFLAERQDRAPRHDRKPAAHHTVPDNLTNREIDVLRLIATGRTNAEIADELVISVRTVERHIGNLYGKIGARGRADATAYALTHGLV